MSHPKGETRGEIYVARRRSNGEIKVGFTTMGVEKRLGAHLGSLGELELLHVYEGTWAEERALHARISASLGIRCRRGRRSEVYQPCWAVLAILIEFLGLPVRAA